MMRVDQIWSYPIKSMNGGRLDAAELDEDGIVGDRMWALRDEQRDAIASARRLSQVSRLSAVVRSDGVTEIALPDGTYVATDAPDVDERLSTAIGHPVSMWSKQPATNVDFYRRGQPDDPDLLTDLRAIFGRIDDEPLPDLSVFPPSIFEFEYPPGNLFDVYPLMLMTTTAVRSLQRALPESAIDERRFRPSLVIDCGPDAVGHPEFEWTGRRLRIGSTEVQIGARCPRCVAVTRQFSGDLPCDRNVLRHIVRDLDQNVGVYATVITGGSIAVDDDVQFC